jgi:cytochrome c-type biogenesis protein CcmF
MVVHIGVILVAVALVTSNAYTESTELELVAGEPAEWSGHTFELVDVTSERDARTEAVSANVQLDGDRVYAPAVTTFLSMGRPIGTPSVRTGLTHDVYLTIAGTNAPVVGSGEATIEVFKKPLILWMWIGGALMALGTVLAAFPGKRRRNPIDPVSARLPSDDAAATETPTGPTAGSPAGPTIEPVPDAADESPDEDSRPTVVAGD